MNGHADLVPWPCEPAMLDLGPTSCKPIQSAPQGPLFDQVGNKGSSTNCRSSTSEHPEHLPLPALRRSGDSNELRPGMLPNEDVMKQKVRDALTKPEYNVADFYHKTGIWRKIATNPIFENTTLGVICLNGLWMMID